MDYQLWCDESRVLSISRGRVPCCECGQESPWIIGEPMIRRDGSKVANPDTEAICEDCAETRSGLYS